MCHHPQELILQSLVKKGYLTFPQCKRKYMNKKDWWRLFSLGSFYFWLDVIATASLVPEVPNAASIVSGRVHHPAFT